MADPARLTGVAGSIVLVRHGETTWITEGRFQGRSDPPLSPLGERQARRVAARLAATGAAPALPLPAAPPLGVWHSPLERASVVARAISAAYGLQPRPVEDLVELDQGSWEGLVHEEVLARDGDRLAAWRRDPVGNEAPGGESLAAAAVRAARAATILVDAIAAAVAPATSPGTPHPPTSHVLGYGAPGATGEPWPWVVAVAHDGLLRLLLMDLLGVPLERFWAFPFGLCSITIVELRNGIARLRAHNLSDHLDGLPTRA